MEHRNSRAIIFPKSITGHILLRTPSTKSPKEQHATK